MNHVVDKYKLRRIIKLQHELVHAHYDESNAKWNIRIRRPKPDCDGEFEEFEDVVDVLFGGMGALSRWKWPDIDGLEEFKGRLLHTAGWEVKDGESWEEGMKDWKNKRVAVIGSVRFPVLLVCVL